MIIFQKMNPMLFWQMDFRLVAAFSENVVYDRSFKLPFNVISCRCEAEESPESFIRNELTGEHLYARPGQILFIPCELPIFIHRRADFNCYDLHFTLEHFPGKDLFRGMKEIRDLSSQYNALELKDIFSVQDPKTAAARMRAFVFQICTDFLPETNETPEWRFQELTRMVRDHITAEWTVEYLAEKACMSPGAFSREFSANMGCTAKKFLMNELLLKALNLLQDPKKDIQTIAKELHFSSPFYFSKFFKKAYGIPPSEYADIFHCNIPSGENR